MLTKHLYLDANGTLFTNRTETGLWKDVGFGLAGYHWKQGEKGRALGLLKVAGYDLFLKAIVPYKLHILDEPGFERRMYDRFNPKVLQGEPFTVIDGLVKIHAAEKAQHKLRREVAEAVREFRERGGNPAIVSTGCRGKIVYALNLSGYGDVFPPAEVVANEFELQGDQYHVKRFNNIGVDPEKEVERQVRERGQDPAEAAFMLHDYRGINAALWVRDRGGRVFVPLEMDEALLDGVHLRIAAEAWSSREGLRALLQK